MPGLMDFAHSVEELLDIEPEDLGLIILRIVRDLPPSFAMSNLEMPLWNANVPGYPPHKGIAVRQALTEAWQWLLTVGLLIPDPEQPNGFFRLTRRGRRLKDTADIEAYRKGGLLPTANLQPVLHEKVRPMFLRGDYELATIEAFKQVEISVRSAASLPADLVGVELMREAFRPTTGKLTDKTSVKGERDAISHLFAGAFGHGRNPVSHRTVNLTSVEAAALSPLGSLPFSRSPASSWCRRWQSRSGRTRT
jgi:uncharacterized protein (TIGR02391 family)